LKFACTTADAAPSATTLLTVETCIEGQDLQVLRKGTANAKPVTLSFWVKSFQTGTFVCELYDENNNRSVSALYTVSASATWEFKTLTFPADATGQIANDNNSGMRVSFYIYAGSTYTSGTLQTTWGTLSNPARAVGQTNIGSSTSNTWQITGVQFEVGSVPSQFERRAFQTELALCQRYYEFGSFFQQHQNNDTVRNAYDIIFYKVTKRVTPTTVTGTNSSSTNLTSATSQTWDETTQRVAWRASSLSDFVNTHSWTASADM